MAQINEAPQIHRRKAGLRPVKKHSLKTDMTPMVDLGFLLIAFFVMTTEMSKPRKMDLIVPKPGPAMPVSNSTALTVLLTGTNQVFYYHGDWTEAVSGKEVFQTTLNTLNGIGKVIREKQEYLEMTKPTKEGRAGLMLVIKPAADTPYEQVVKMLDETIIHQITHHAMVNQEEQERSYIKNLLKTGH